MAGTSEWSLLAAVVILIYYLYDKYYVQPRHYWTSRGVPILKTDNFLSQLIKPDAVNIDKTKYEDEHPYGGYFEMGGPFIFVRDLELMKRICVKDFDHFVNGIKFETDDVIQHTLPNQRDTQWKRLRSKMTPTFTTGKIRNMFPIMQESSDKLMTYLKDMSAKNNGALDLDDALGKFAMDIIVSSAFGINSQIFQKSESIVAKMSKQIQIHFTPLNILRLLAFHFIPHLRKLFKFRLIDHEAESFFAKIIKDTIKHRETTGERRNDFLQLMIDTKNGKLQADKEIDQDDAESQVNTPETEKDDSFKIDDDIIVANCIVFIFGGFDTIQSALNFGCYALALNPEVQNRLRKELQDATEGTDGKLNYDLVSHNEYLDKFVNETLRMYPPAIRMARMCTKEYHVPDTPAVIPKDTVVLMSIYQLHLDKKHYSNPEVFNPENFSKENKAKRHPYAFTPFAQGPRGCIGNRFALAETKALIAHMALNFEISPNGKTAIPMKFAKHTNLKPANGMWLNMKPIGK